MVSINSPLSSLQIYHGVSVLPEVNDHSNMTDNKTAKQMKSKNLKSTSKCTIFSISVSLHYVSDLMTNISTVIC